MFYRADIPVRTSPTTTFIPGEQWWNPGYTSTVNTPQPQIAFSYHGGISDYVACENYNYLNSNNIPIWSFTLPAQHVRAELGTQMITIYNGSTQQWGIQIPVGIIP